MRCPVLTFIVLACLVVAGKARSYVGAAHGRDSTGLAAAPFRIAMFNFSIGLFWMEVQP
jgi:hypothetical protein